MAFKVETWLLSHANIIVPILVIILMILIGGVLVAILQLSNLSMVESGLQYNQFERII